MNKLFSRRWCKGWVDVLVGITLAASGLAAHATEALPSEVMIRNVEFVLIPEGYFYRYVGQLPHVASKGEMTKVWQNAYYIAKYEARARDLVPFMNQEKPASRLYGGDFESCSMRKGKDGTYALVSPNEDLPATHLSWNLADAWARWMGFRLPTESEWEKAARGTDQRKYPWGNQEPDDTYVNFMTQSSCLVWPVDRAAKGRSPFGVYNMAGNVREFVTDWHDGERDAGRLDFIKTLERDARNSYEPKPNALPHQLKGGRWASVAQQLEISHRFGWRDDDDPFQCNGARFALDVAVVSDHLAKGSAVVTRP